MRVQSLNTGKIRQIFSRYARYSRLAFSGCSRFAADRQLSKGDFMCLRIIIAGTNYGRQNNRYALCGAFSPMKNVLIIYDRYL